MTGEIDRISEAIGELRAAVAAIDRYFHDHRHDVAGYAQRVEAISHQWSRELTRATEKLAEQIDQRARDDAAAMDAVRARLAIVEQREQRREGATGALGWLLRSPVIGWILGGALALYAWIRAKHG